MKLEKRGEVSAEEAAAAEAAQETVQAEQTAGRKKPVLLYLVILFAIALFLILFSFLAQNRVNAMEMQEMQAEVDAARELQVKYEQSQAENASLRTQLEEANALAAEESRVRQALELVWQLERYYVSGDNEACRAVLEAMDEHPESFVRCASEFPYYPAVQQMVQWFREGAFGQIIEARFAIKHSSDMDLTKPINWKRTRSANGDYGCMGDLGIHTQHLPFRLGFEPLTVSAQLANIARTRPDANGNPVPCETWDNAIVLCEARDGAGDHFPMQLEMKRMAPGCTNTVEYEIYGLKMSAKFTTDDPNAVRYTLARGREQAWARLVVGQKTLYPVITGSIFEFGFSDSLLQMFAAFISELRGLPCPFGCFTPNEALLSHRVLTAALESYTQQRVVQL